MDLPVKAVTTANGRQHEYSVSIVDRGGRPVLRINGTPGGWYLDTFMGVRSDHLYIDMGQGWILTNVKEIQQAARSANPQESAAEYIVRSLLEEDPVDRYDALDQPISRMKARVDQLAQALEAAGVEVTEKTYPDYEVDGEVTIGHPPLFYGVQVTLDGQLVLNEYTGATDEEFGSMQVATAATIPAIVAAVQRRLSRKDT